MYRKIGFVEPECQLIFIDVCRLEERGFCNGCAAIEEEADIHYSSCPTDFDMCDENCIRHSDVSEALSLVRRADEILLEACRDNRNLGDARDDDGWY